MTKLEEATVCIIGLGLIGGSLALGLKSAGKAARVHGIDIRPGVLKEALARGAVDRADTDAAGAADADLVVLAVPALKARAVLEGVAAHLRPGCVVTDVLSTKAHVLSLFAELLPPAVSSVGGHPLAGSTRSGLGHARPDLFHGAPFVITPGERTTPAAVRLVTEMAETLGCFVVEMTPQEHDRAVAVLSHLPYLVSVALALGADEFPAFRRLAASGFRDATRLAGSEPEIAGDMCLTNREEIRRTGARFLCRLEELLAALATDEQLFRTVITGAARSRRNLGRDKGWAE